MLISPSKTAHQGSKQNGMYIWHRMKYNKAGGLKQNVGIIVTIPSALSVSLKLSSLFSHRQQRLSLTLPRPHGACLNCSRPSRLPVKPSKCYKPREELWRWSGEGVSEGRGRLFEVSQSCYHQSKAGRACCVYCVLYVSGLRVFPNPLEIRT